VSPKSQTKEWTQGGDQTLEGFAFGLASTLHIQNPEIEYEKPRGGRSNVCNVQCFGPAWLSPRDFFRREGFWGRPPRDLRVISTAEVRKDGIYFRCAPAPGERPDVWDLSIPDRRATTHTFSGICEIFFWTLPPGGGQKSGIFRSRTQANKKRREIPEKHFFRSQPRLAREPLPLSRLENRREIQGGGVASG
jgi:hypothetical protein